jgi:hypothetical protein
MVQVLIALVFVFFLPGYFLVNALYPRKGELDPEYDLLYRITLGIMMSVAITIFIGIGLNSMGVDPETGMGYFLGPYIWVALIVITIIFFILGWLRGAYPFLGKIKPSLYRLPPREEGSAIIYKKDDAEKAMELKELSAKRQRLKGDLADLEKKSDLHTGGAKDIAMRKKKKIQRELKSIDNRIGRLEMEIMGETL